MMLTLLKFFNSRLKRYVAKRVTFDDLSWIEWLDREAILYGEVDGHRMGISWYLNPGLLGGRVLYRKDIRRWKAPHQLETVGFTKCSEIEQKVVRYCKSPKNTARDQVTGDPFRPLIQHGDQMVELVLCALRAFSKNPLHMRAGTQLNVVIVKVIHVTAALILTFGLLIVGAWAADAYHLPLIHGWALAHGSILFIFPLYFWGCFSALKPLAGRLRVIH